MQIQIGLNVSGIEELGEFQVTQRFGDENRRDRVRLSLGPKYLFASKLMPVLQAYMNKKLVSVLRRHTEAKTDLKEFLVHREPNSFQRPMGHCRWAHDNMLSSILFSFNTMF